MSPQDREHYIARLLDCDLLILDDFGMERQTEFAREQIFGIVNGRYLAGKPMIVTTNLTLQQMKKPDTMAEKRIYDRVLEVCVPVCFDGESLRTEKAPENLRFYRSLMEGESS
ncbi:MAG: ATP-binding protein [Oscillospiraceae bacterium]|nr:ATP-binding protein [Oscillospiraceae bacterium]